MARIVATRRARPDVIIQAHERAVREGVGVIAGEPWNNVRFVQRLLEHCDTLDADSVKRLVVALAAGLDEGRVRGFQHQHAFYIQVLKWLETTILTGGDSSHAWPLLGVADPAGVPAPALAPLESQGLAAFHKEQRELREARLKPPPTPKAGATDVEKAEKAARARAAKAQKAEERRKAAAAAAARPQK